jgi:hypothetical protein
MRLHVAPTRLSFSARKTFIRPTEISPLWAATPQNFEEMLCALMHGMREQTVIERDQLTTMRTG